jgi:hypothetical protein
MGWDMEGRCRDEEEVYLKRRQARWYMLATKRERKTVESQRIHDSQLLFVRVSILASRGCPGRRLYSLTQSTGRGRADEDDRSLFAKERESGSVGSVPRRGRKRDPTYEKDPCEVRDDRPEQRKREPDVLYHSGGVHPGEIT